MAISSWYCPEIRNLNNPERENLDIRFEGKKSLRLNIQIAFALCRPSRGYRGGDCQEAEINPQFYSIVKRSSSME